MCGVWNWSLKVVWGFLFVVTGSVLCLDFCLVYCLFWCVGER